MINLNQLFIEFDKHLMEDDTPSEYFDKLLDEGAFDETYPLTMLRALAKTPQSVQHHPEGDVWKHTMMVVDRAAGHRSRSKLPRVFMWAALLHDLGKPDTTRNRKGKITAYDHDKLGQKLAVQFLEQMTEDRDFVEAVSRMVRWHMQTLFVTRNMQFADIDTMLEQVQLEEIALLSLCDRLGRGEMNKKKEEEERKNIEQFTRAGLASLSRKR